MQPHSAFDSGPIRIVIAAAQVSLREGLRRQLESEPRIEVVGEAPDGRMARMLIRRFKPDILLIDCALNRVVRLTPALARRTCSSTTGVVVLISTARTQNIIEALSWEQKVSLRVSVFRVIGKPAFKAFLRDTIGSRRRT